MHKPIDERIDGATPELERIAETLSSELPIMLAARDSSYRARQCAAAAADLSRQAAALADVVGTLLDALDRDSGVAAADGSLAVASDLASRLSRLAYILQSEGEEPASVGREESSC